MSVDLILLVGSGIALVACALGVTWTVLRAGVPLRVEPWPGLTGVGAVLMIALAAFLAGTQLVLGPADLHVQERAAVPYLPLATLGAAVSLTLAASVFCMPGAATAACGVYLLARSIVALVVPSVAPPPLFLVGAMAFECALWLRTGDLRALVAAWPWRRKRVRAPDPPLLQPRHLTQRRAATGGALFGVLFALQEPSFDLFLDGNPTAWTPELVAAGAALSAMTGGAAAWLTYRVWRRVTRPAAS